MSESQEFIDKHLTSLSTDDTIMQVKNGELVQVDAQEVIDSITDSLTEVKTEFKDNDPTHLARPRSGCHHCYGLGRDGWDPITKKGLLCRCLKRLPETHKQTGEILYLTVGELKEIIKEYTI